MHELDLLHQLRSEVPEPGADALNAAEARMMGTILSPVSRTRKTARRRPMGLRVVFAGSLTTAAATVALVAQVAGGPAQHSSSSPGNPELTPISAVELLDRAAIAAERRPELHPRSSQFIVYKSVTMYPAYASDRRYLSRTKRTVWLSVDGTREGALTQEPLQPKQYPGWPIPSGANNGVGTTHSAPLPTCDRHPADNARTDYTYLRTLPTDPARMLQVLKGRQSGDPSPEDRAWTAAGDLMRESYLPPAQRAAVFRAAKLSPGVTVVQDAEDAAGRRGIAVARVNDEQGVRDELIFNPTTFLYQGERMLVLDAAKAEAAVPRPVGTAKAAPDAAAHADGPGVPVGTPLVSTAELSVAVTDTAPKFPSTGKHCG